MPASLVSIVMPVYNVQDYIADSLRSLIKQTYRPLEIVLIDDGSSDNSMEIAQRILQEAEIQHTVFQQENGGVAKARNQGIRMAKGDLVMLVDSDDCLHPQTVEILAKQIEDHFDVECSVSGFEIITSTEKADCNADGKAYKRSGAKAIECYYNREEIYISPAMLLRRNFILEKGIFFDENCFFAEDDLFVWHVLSEATNIVYYSGSLYKYLRHENSTMTSASYDRFLSGYTAALRYNAEIIQKAENAKAVKDSFLPRHAFGVLHAAAKVLSYVAFCRLFEEIGFRAHRATLLKYEKNSRMSATLLLSKLTLRLFYLVCRSV